AVACRLRARPAEKRGGRVRERPMLEVRERVEPRHRRVVDAGAQPALQRLPRSWIPLGQLASGEQDCGVGRKYMAVVGEQYEIEAGELPLGGENLDDVDAAGGERREGQRGVPPGHLGRPQSRLTPPTPPPLPA